MRLTALPAEASGRTVMAYVTVRVAPGAIVPIAIVSVRPSGATVTVSFAAFTPSMRIVPARRRRLEAGVSLSTTPRLALPGSVLRTVTV